MTFADALAQRIQQGNGVVQAIRLAMVDSGVKNASFKDVQRVVAANPKQSPIAYKRIR